MTSRVVRFNLTCTDEDPQGPARVLGVFAARSLLPRYFISTTQPGRGIVEIEVEIQLDASDAFIPEHLARVIERIPTVEYLRLFVNGSVVSLDVDPQ